MGQREKRHLGQQRAQPCRQKEKPQHKQDVIQPLGHDMVKPDRNIARKCLPSGGLVPARKRDRIRHRTGLQIAVIRRVHPHLADHQHPEFGRPAHAHLRRTIRQRHAKPHFRGARHRHIAKRANRNTFQHGLQRHTTCRDRYRRGHLRPERHEPLFKRGRLHRAQHIIAFGLRRIGGISHRRHIDPRDKAFQIQPHIKDQCVVLLGHIGNRRQDLMGGRRGQHRGPNQHGA